VGLSGEAAHEHGLASRACLDHPHLKGLNPGADLNVFGHRFKHLSPEATLKLSLFERHVPAVFRHALAIFGRVSVLLQVLPHHLLIRSTRDSRNRLFSQ